MNAFATLIAGEQHARREHQRQRNKKNCRRDRERHGEARNAAHREWYADNAEAQREVKRSLYAADPEKFRARKRIESLSVKQAEKERARKRKLYRRAPVAGAARVRAYYYARKQATAILRDVLTIIERITA